MNLKMVCVLGAGTMGAGIAQWFTQAGLKVQLADVNLDVCTQALDKVHRSWDKLAAKGKFTAQQVSEFKSNLTVCSPEKFDSQADLLVEAIVENLDVKIKVFQDFDQHFDKKTIFASNTSSIPIDSMAKGLSLQRRANFLGLHFFNPAPIMKLVEVISGHYTHPDHAQSLADWFTSKGKKPALCHDGPGFIVNRVARNYYGEPFRIIKTAEPEKIQEVDQVLKNVGGFRMGPFELMDLIGIDVNYSVSESVWTSFYYEERFAPHAIQRSMVQSGRLGRKTKEGFYQYE